jgi:nitrogen fixation protein FixH
MKNSNKSAGITWLIVVISLLSIMLMANGTLLWKALDDPSHVVVKDYYKKAVDWDSTAEQIATNDKLGWQVDLAFDEVAPGVENAIDDGGKPNVLLRVYLKDNAGQPLKDAVVNLSCYFNARAANVFESTLKKDGDAYSSALRLGPAGVWQFYLEIEHAGSFFTWRDTRQLGWQ